MKTRLTFALLLFIVAGACGQSTIEMRQIGDTMTSFTISDNYPKELAPKWVLTETKAHVKISTDYPAVYDLITTRYADSIKYVTIQYKKDKGGSFKHFAIYLPKGMGDEIEQYITSPINKELLCR